MCRLNKLAVWWSALVDSDDLVSIYGTVVTLYSGGAIIEGISPFVRIGDILAFDDGESAFAEVTRVDVHQLTATFCDPVPRISIGSRCRFVRKRPIAPTRKWLGRVIDGNGSAIDGKGELHRGQNNVHRTAGPLPVLARAPVSRPVRTGVHVIDLFTPLCFGQRIGIFAGSGVGKSTLLAMIANNAEFDSIVVALVGERGREVREFVEDVLGPALEKSIVVVSTSNESAARRRNAALTALTAAESLRDQGDNVLLLFDSLTRYAHACRDLALSAGELPVTRGFPPSVFAELPRLLERAGPGLRGKGTITGVFSVLVDGDDHNDPVADNIRGTLDGHIVLDREIANRAQFPAINILASISRLASACFSQDQTRTISSVRRLISLYENSREMRSIVGNLSHSDKQSELASALVPRLYKLLSQDLLTSAKTDVFGELAALIAEVDKDGLLHLS